MENAARHFKVVQDVDGTYLLKGELTIHDLDYLKDFLEAEFFIFYHDFSGLLRL